MSIVSLFHTAFLQKKNRETKKLASKLRTRHSAKITEFLYWIEERALSEQSGLRPQSNAMKGPWAWVRQDTWHLTLSYQLFDIISL